MPEVDDGGMLISKPPTATEVAGDGDGSGDSNHEGDDHNGIIQIGTSWSQTGEVWRLSAPGDHHIVYDRNEDEYDDDENDDDHDEEEPAGDY